jgi:hypothetical protein
MDFNAMLSQLKNELELLNSAIFAIERLAGSSGKRRGRPPKWMSEAKGEEAEPEAARSRKSRTFSPEARKRMAEAQRQRWAARRAAKTADEPDA